MSIWRIVRIVAQAILPAETVKDLVAVYGHLQPAVRSYSQKGEDLILGHYFASRGLAQGFYLDIGCFHPKWISNTYRLHKAGWHGAAVDIDANKMRTFRQARGARVRSIQAAVVGHAEPGQTLTAYKFRTATGWSDLDTLSLATATAYRARGAGEFTEQTVDALGINDLLASLPHVHLMNIDIEGLDTEVLLALDLDKYRIDAILFEDNACWGGDAPVVTKLTAHGYERLFVSGGSVCYVLPPRADAGGDG